MRRAARNQILVACMAIIDVRDSELDPETYYLVLVGPGLSCGLNDSVL